MKRVLRLRPLSPNGCCAEWSSLNDLICCRVGVMTKPVALKDGSLLIIATRCPGERPGTTCDRARYRLNSSPQGELRDKLESYPWPDAVVWPCQPPSGPSCPARTCFIDLAADALSSQNAARCCLPWAPTRFWLIIDSLIRFDTKLHRTPEELVMVCCLARLNMKPKNAYG